MSKNPWEWWWNMWLPPQKPSCGDIHKLVDEAIAQTRQSQEEVKGSLKELRHDTRNQRMIFRSVADRLGCDNPQDEDQGSAI